MFGQRSVHFLKAWEIDVWSDRMRDFLECEKLLFEVIRWGIFWSVRGCCLKWLEEEFFRLWDAAVWSDQMRDFSKREKLLFEVIGGRIFQSVRSCYLKWSEEGFFQSVRGYCFGIQICNCLLIHQHPSIHASLKMCWLRN